MGFPCSSVSKEFSCSAGDPGSIPGSGGSPGKSHGQRSLVGCSPWGCKESGMTKQTNTYLLPLVFQISFRTNTVDSNYMDF